MPEMRVVSFTLHEWKGLPIWPWHFRAQVVRGIWAWHFRSRCCMQSAGTMSRTVHGGGDQSTKISQPPGDLRLIGCNRKWA